MDEKHERMWRRKAMRLTLRGLRPRDIRKQIPRSRRWLWKWQTRYHDLGWDGLKSQSRRPQHCRPRYSKTIRRRGRPDSPASRACQDRSDRDQSVSTRMVMAISQTAVAEPVDDLRHLA